MTPAKFIQLLRQQHGESLVLCDAATPDQIEGFEEICGMPLPDELSSLYQVANGEAASSNFGVFLGLHFVDLYGVYLALKSFTDMREDNDTFDELNQWAKENGNPDGKVRLGYSHPDWIPFAKDFGGNFLAIDMSPGPNGNVGQVINIGRDEDFHFVLAPSLSEFLSWIASQIDAGNTKVEDGTFAYNGQDASGHFLDEARKLFSQ